MYPRIFSSIFQYTRSFMKFSCYNTIAPINLLKINRNTFLIRLPQICTVQKHYERNFHKRQNQTQAKFLIVSSSFLITLFGDDEEEKDDTEELKTTIKRSILLIQKEQYQKAEQMLHVALRQAQLLQHYDGITYVYDVLANLAYTVEDYNKAKRLFVTVLQRLIDKGVPKHDLAIIHISLKVANIYEKLGNTIDAENGYSYCLQQLQNRVTNKEENEDVLKLLGITLEWYAVMLFSKSQYNDALKYFTEAYDISVKLNGIHHEQTVILLNDLGTINCMLKEYDRAVEHVSKAIEIGKKLPDMDDIGSIHVNLGKIFIEKGLYEEAKKHCTQGQNLAKAKEHHKSLQEAAKCLEKIKSMSS